MKEIIITENIIETILPKYFQFVIKETEAHEDGSRTTQYTTKVQELYNEILNELTKAGVRVIVTGASHLIIKQLKHSSAFNKILERDDVFDRSHQALNALGYSLSPLSDMAAAE